MARKIEKDEGNSYCRKFVIELYHDWDNYKEIRKYIDSHYLLYLGITHDSDVWTESDYIEKMDYMNENNIQVGDIKKVHDYFVVDFNNPRYRNTIAKELSIDPKFVRKCRHYKSAMEYAIHFNSPDKHLYSVNDTFGTLKLDLIKFVQSHINEEERSNEILDIIVNSPGMTIYQLGREVNKRGLYSIFIRGYSFYKDILDGHNLGVY